MSDERFVQGGGRTVMVRRLRMVYDRDGRKVVAKGYRYECWEELGAAEQGTGALLLHHTDHGSWWQQITEGRVMRNLLAKAWPELVGNTTEVRMPADGIVCLTPAPPKGRSPGKRKGEVGT